MQGNALIVSIVRKGWGSKVLEASVKAGARGGTVIFGRGAGVHEQERIFGMSIEPEKEILLTIVDRRQIRDVLDAIVEAGELNEVGRGLAVVLSVEEVAGVAHFMKEALQQD